MKCKQRSADHRDPLSGELNRLCWIHFGYAKSAEEHEESQRYFKDMRSRNPRWMPPLGGDEP